MTAPAPCGAPQTDPRVLPGHQGDDEHREDSALHPDVLAYADQIVGLGTAGETPPSSVRDMARVKRAAERARDRMAAEINAARRDPYQRAADDEAARRAQAAKAAETYAHRREVEALMRPGGRHG